MKYLTSPSLVESHLLVVRDVSKLDCMVQLKLRTFQVETPVEKLLSIGTTRREGFKNTSQLRRQRAFQSFAYLLPINTHQILLTVTHLPYRFSHVLIRQSFVCYLELSPARHSATSGAILRSTLGKLLLREEVHGTTPRMERGESGPRGMGYCFQGNVTTITRREHLRHNVWARGVFAADTAFALE